MEDQRKIVIVGCGNYGTEVIAQLLEWAKDNRVEIIRQEHPLSPGEELQAMFSEVALRLDHSIYVLATLQEETELEFLESIIYKYDIRVIATPNSDGVTWFKNKFPKALVYSWQQAQELCLHKHRLVSLQEITELKELNRATNNGRGSNVLDSVIRSLEQGDVEGAHQIAYIDSDKLSQYRNVFNRLLTLGFAVN
jgi:hypothetical protein